jgi:hypothetical protein
MNIHSTERTFSIGRFVLPVKGEAGSGTIEGMTAWDGGKASAPTVALELVGDSRG